jgi:hypothetical protein
MAVASLAASADNVWAQGTREETIAGAQAEKAKRLTHYRPSGAEQVLLRLQKLLVLDPNGFYPRFESVYSGGGFTVGAGYRRYLGDRLNWNVSGLYSAKNYKLFELALHSPRPRYGRFDFNLVTGWRDATQVPYHGLGIDSPETSATYRMQQGSLGGRLALRPVPWTRIGGGIGFESFTLADGPEGHTTLDDLFSAETAPGLGQSPDYLYTFASAAIDSRPSPEYARRGSLYELSYHRYDDTNDTYSFDRLDAEIVQHIPILRENWVVSLRGRLQTTLGDEDQVPYFLLPSLGSGSTLRGYSSWRFRDRHGLLFSGEWRWLPSRLAMDAALFYDVGTVADRRDALSLGRTASNVGIGVRFHSLEVTPLRIELAKGREGFHLVFAGSAAF